MIKKTPRRRTMKVCLMMALVLVVAMTAYPAAIQAQGYSPNSWRAEVEARSRAWERRQQELQRGREETQRRMREASQRNQEAWQRSARKQFDSAWQRGQAAWQRAEENRAKDYTTRDRVYRPGEKHWSDPTRAQLSREPGEAAAAAGRWAYDLRRADNQLRREAAERQRQAATARRARDDERLMGGPNYRPQPRTPVNVRDGGPGDRDVPQRLSPASAAAIREIGRHLENAQKSTVRDAGGRSTGDGEGSSRNRDAGAGRDRTRDTPAREVKDWFDRVFEKGSRRP